MSGFDDYFTNDDKPFAENLNDALLVSNVFDYTVTIELPTMFGNGEFVDTNGKRKAGVSIVQLLPESTNVNVQSDSIEFEGNGSELWLDFYPNFNSFGRIKSVSWESSNDMLECTIFDSDGVTQIARVSNGEELDNLSGLRGLKVFKLLFNSSNVDVLENINIVLENKVQERYGADVSIGNVSGLSTALSGKVDKVTGKGLSSNDFTDSDVTTLSNVNTAISNQEFHHRTYATSQIKMDYYDSDETPPKVWIDAVLTPRYYDYSSTFQGNILTNANFKPPKKNMVLLCPCIVNDSNEGTLIMVKLSGASSETPRLTFNFRTLSNDSTNFPNDYGVTIYLHCSYLAYDGGEE